MQDVFTFFYKILFYYIIFGRSCLEVFEKILNLICFKGDFRPLESFILLMQILHHMYAAKKGLRGLCGALRMGLLKAEFI